MARNVPTPTDRSKALRRASHLWLELARIRAEIPHALEDTGRLAELGRCATMIRAELRDVAAPYMADALALARGES